MIEVEHRDGRRVAIPVESLRAYFHKHRSSLRLRTCLACRGRDASCVACGGLLVEPVTELVQMAG